LALLPTSSALIISAARAFTEISSSVSAGPKWFVSGAAAYTTLHVLGILRFKRAYVFAHESCHALAAWLRGGKVFGMVVKEESGHVDLSKMDAFIALAPYWIPLYALLTVGVYRVGLWAGFTGREDIFLAVMGGFLAFHLLHTASSLWATHQSDLDQAGVTLSISLVLLLNAIVLLVSMKCLFPTGVSLQEALRWTLQVSKGFWTMLYTGLVGVAAAAREVLA